ncbi:succinylarginine dihydrolase [Novosphingobium aromaticivorans DSM 12444]|uniref:N-succinylarginine dihydrolase n=1 Tax=Novosphingobium aromaticivorans (strain ATCC 700278 / DSM 12444 / CCUG 56034 / CIP 105152 / NBRC 16084 / F199) TaxID=279238 RepID=ASTB_NOVAD|nr:N-succinylarginine dihydrolase [Novosphingobium aromaticivorans]Q2G9Z6.1 RecName: Full=N-succinylarginine dihydrolase [Novosphingobium aromaticivorans DSM 12444]ABD25327.1 succinylarginine dihydrolase [Novosphingobium aromaticivorans DSM 12444]SCX90112.1 succinylarginine dihydrolase [Novosphingobium aromaticivorans]
MPLVEINFDGLVGPSHNYAGLSLGNLASASNAGEVSYPRAAALQGLGKMRHNLALGLTQGLFAPLPRPNPVFLGALGLNAIDEVDQAQRRLRAAAWSASSMWTANAATVSPAPDTPDGRCHLTAANLVTMPHRSQEWPDTVRQLRLAFADAAHFAVHDAVPACFGDEGAANHMRMCKSHDAPGIEIFVYGTTGGAFPARQHEQASRAVARLHGLAPERCLFVEQAPEAIAAGAFHNDVVAVANERVLFTHEQAFANPEATYAAIRERLPEAEIVVVPSSVVSLADAIRSYLFNAQLLTLPSGEMGLVIPVEAWETPSVRGWLEAHLASNGPIRRVLPVDVRQSMANGGGPACLRLRVVADPATVDPRFLLDEARVAIVEEVVRRHWPEQIDPADLGSDILAQTVHGARGALLAALELSELA